MGALVFNGKKQKTTGGLTAQGLVRNKRGKVVSKRQSAHGKLQFKRIEPWLEAVMSARAALHTRGFVAINGKTIQGKALYIKARAMWSRPAMSNRSPAKGTGASCLSAPSPKPSATCSEALASEIPASVPLVGN